MKLYGFGQSRSFRPLWALEECGLDYEYIAIALRTDAEVANSAKNPDYLALNVQGKVPTLVDGDLVLTECFAIVNYIARLAPDSGLIPKISTIGYADYDELIFFILAELEQPLWSKGKHAFALPEEHRIPQMMDTAKFEFAKAVNALDHLLGDEEFAIGNKFSMVDLLLAHTFNWAIRFEFDVPEKYAELRNRHYKRPAAIRALAVVE
ncbi:MAG: glutathione S-transferase [SAR86 cluster bacterium]|uniref:Glutathione S-transferase n=1 Tax=SAR86 cluster bacterium TaxID=2030880 RepID=A0A2A5AZY0_9GAMM|nr:MAG: glutathione S-transferase [SAR86 cluster bacterium]